MTSIYEPLLRALEAQKAGDTAAREKIAGIASQICGTRVFRDEVLTAAQVSAIEQLLREWTEMFASPPGRADALETVIELLRDIRGRPNDADLHLRQTSQWGRLMSLRGPGVDVVMRTCSTCRTEYVGITFGSFSDGREPVLACNSCGHIRIDPSESPASRKCPCGGVLHRGCPSCGAQQCEEKWLARPYQYFSTHTYDLGGSAG
jgi:hypothetical protein